MIKNILIIAVGLLALSLLYAFVVPSLDAPTTMGCTMEAKICPDGSAVGRSGPKCEFTPCPPAAPVTYLCADNKTITATFSEYSVYLELPEGRTIDLAKVMDGDEVKYILESKPIEFWVREDSAFLTENDASTFTACRLQDVSFPEL